MIHMNVFLNRHKILTIVFIIAVYLIIKNSSIPYWSEPNAIVSFLFDKPEGAIAEVAKIVDIFASAYVTSLIFYFFVDFYPRIQEERKAQEILKSSLIRLYMYMDEFIAIINYSAKRQKLVEKSISLDKLKILDTSIQCYLNIYVNEKEYISTVYEYNLLKDGDKLRNLISNCCQEIVTSPSLPYCDARLIHLISEVQISKLLKQFPSGDDEINKLPLGDVEHHQFSINYYEFVKIHTELGEFVSEKHHYIIRNAAEDELRNHIELQMDFF